MSSVSGLFSSRVARNDVGVTANPVQRGLRAFTSDAAALTPGSTASVPTWCTPTDVARRAARVPCSALPARPSPAVQMPTSARMSVRMPTPRHRVGPNQIITVGPFRVGKLRLDRHEMRGVVDAQVATICK